MAPVKKVSLEQLTAILASLPDNPRMVVSGNFATPHALLAHVDSVVPEYVLHALNAQRGLPDRDGVVLETCFVGPGMRKSPRLRYVPCRLSLVPVLYRTALPPDVVLIHTSAQRHDTVSLGTEVNVMPAAIEATRERGGLVIAQANPRMPYTYGDAQIYEHEIDYLVEIEEEVTTHSPGALDDISRRSGTASPPGSRTARPSSSASVPSRTRCWPP